MRAMTIRWTFSPSSSPSRLCWQAPRGAQAPRKTSATLPQACQAWILLTKYSSWVNNSRDKLNSWRLIQMLYSERKARGAVAPWWWVRQAERMFMGTLLPLIATLLLAGFKTSHSADRCFTRTGPTNTLTMTLLRGNLRWWWLICLVNQIFR